MQTIGAILLSLVAVQMGLTVYSTWQQSRGARRQRALSVELLRRQIEAANALRVQRQQAQAHWNGYRKFVVHRKVCEADNVCSFYLVPHDNKPLPLFQPGQYLTFRLPIPGVEKPVVRCYSISSSPDPDAPERAARAQQSGVPPAPGENYYRVTIKRAFGPRDRPEIPPGLASNYFHDHVREGDILDVQAPRGQFVLDTTQIVPVVLAAGGVGITPMLSMLGAVARQQPGREVWLFYGIRNRREHAFKHALEDLARRHENVRLCCCYSHPDPEDAYGRDYHFAEWVSVDLFRRVLGANNYQFYICGPPPMMDSLVSGLKQWGVPDSSIFFEAFGPATVKAAPRKPPGEPAASDTPPGVLVKFDRTGKETAWDPECGNLLEFAERQGVQIDSGCRAGNCGTCVVAIKSGQVVCTSDHGGESEEGTCLTCISAPVGNLVLDA